MPQQRKLSVYWLVFCLLVLPATAAAADEFSAPGPQESAPVRLVTGPHYPPLAADYLPYNGLGAFLVRRILEASGSEVSVDLRPWKRAYRESLAGHYDAVLPYLETPSRQEDFLFSEPVFKADTYAYVSAGSDIHADSMTGLEGLTYCNPLGYADGEKLGQMRSEGKITRLTAPHLNNCFRMLLAGRADFVKINHYVARYSLHHSELPHNAIRALPFVVERVSLHLMVPRTRPEAEELVDEFDRIRGRMEASGQLNALTSWYLETVELEEELR
ncbi:amino acid ABC transporter substrate-binding protein, PAAT family [Marinobacter daqiaonensis]|uniref:Amino acid ABC transporter substrate-binding protein, PAAT family n=1 Tax=Marinobacter daqiaonensis TaxID=650891 RepID=A0A1I6IDP6_9GAMM|nr:ABC transporter substrate-binding protein [Marinobacter daqiaonensis]SFR64816.1 amino acid ABC transporter substrate-binding protein, PAAT family [Marinobacter daqiaonensis]